MAIARKEGGVGFGAAMRGGLADEDHVAGPHFRLLIAESHRFGAFEDVQDLIGVRMYVFGDIAVLNRDRHAMRRLRSWSGNRSVRPGRERLR